MSTYTLADLLHRWSLGQLSDQQAIGHLLQHLAAQGQRLAETEKRVRQLEQLLNSKP